MEEGEDRHRRVCMPSRMCPSPCGVCCRFGRAGPTGRNCPGGRPFPAATSVDRCRPSVRTTTITTRRDDGNTSGGEMQVRKGPAQVCVCTSGHACAHSLISLRLVSSRVQAESKEEETGVVGAIDTSSSSPVDPSALLAELNRCRDENTSLKHQLSEKLHSHEADRTVAVGLAVHREQQECERLLAAAAAAAEVAVRQAQVIMTRSFESRFAAYEVSLEDHQLLDAARAQEGQVREMASQIALQEMMLAVQRNELHSLERRLTEEAAGERMADRFASRLEEVEERHAQLLAEERQQRIDAVQAQEATHELMQMYMRQCDENEQAMSAERDEWRNELSTAHQNQVQTRRIAEVSFGKLLSQYQQATSSWITDRADLFQQLRNHDDVIARQDDSIARLLVENTQLTKQLQAMAAGGNEATPTQNESDARAISNRSSVSVVALDAAAGEVPIRASVHPRFQEANFKPIDMPNIPQDPFAFAAAHALDAVALSHSSSTSSVLSASVQADRRIPTTPPEGTPRSLPPHRPTSQLRASHSRPTIAAESFIDIPSGRHARVVSRATDAVPPSEGDETSSVELWRQASRPLFADTTAAMVGEATLVSSASAASVGGAALDYSSATPATHPLVSGFTVSRTNLSLGGASGNAPSPAALSSGTMVGISQEWRQYQIYKQARSAGNASRRFYPDIDRERQERERNQKALADQIKRAREAALLAEDEDDGDVAFADTQRFAAHPPTSGSSSARARPNGLHYVTPQLVLPLPIATPEERHIHLPSSVRAAAPPHAALGDERELSPTRGPKIIARLPPPPPLVNGLSARANEFIDHAVQSSMPTTYASHPHADASASAGFVSNSISVGGDVSSRGRERMRDLRGKRIKQGLPKSFGAGVGTPPLAPIPPHMPVIIGHAPSDSRAASPPHTVDETASPLVAGSSA